MVSRGMMQLGERFAFSLLESGGGRRRGGGNLLLKSVEAPLDFFLIVLTVINQPVA
jgi:hypothetical protein